ncbi:hypothetical protein K491DRAFT_480147 [Lophiostoma macrostomum CBS 122681]|uniref:Uncharacterized protein n=1 Tax=Lophiostoma macrostomum CBS 122681 TaxID=1314788 RepID=A0A6A6TM66_9PLEO|nr:hypothetical protein K491DRAFT_480147 [Lophiostoma macrostomum CBS 122681]
MESSSNSGSNSSSSSPIESSSSSTIESSFSSPIESSSFPSLPSSPSPSSDSGMNVPHIALIFGHMEPSKPITVSIARDRGAEDERCAASSRAAQTAMVGVSCSFGSRGVSNKAQRVERILVWLGSFFARVRVVRTADLNSRASLSKDFQPPYTSMSPVCTSALTTDRPEADVFFCTKKIIALYSEWRVKVL